MEELENKTTISNGCFKGCFITLCIIGIVLLSLTAFFKFADFDTNPPKEGDWNNDGEVDDKDLDKFIEWKSKQEDD